MISDGVKTRIPCDSIPLVGGMALRPGSSAAAAGNSLLANCMDLVVVVVMVADEDEAKQQLDGAMESATVTTAI